MAKKNIDPIVSLGTDIDNLCVQKSKPLFSLWKSDLSLAEFKILDTYLSRIDSRKPDKRVVLFNKGELESLLGVSKINSSELEARLTHLMGSVVKIDDGNEKKGFRLVSLFEEAVAEQDDYGSWQVRMECTQKAMKYFFDIEHLGYLRYKLRCITSIGSRYSYIMFMYLESNRFRKTWSVDVNELKSILRCDTEETYKAFKRFNDLILKKTQLELHDKTECRFSYKTLKSGRNVSRIEFTLETIQDEEDMFIDMMDKCENASDYPNDGTDLWIEALEDLNFKSDELAEIGAALRSVPAHKLPDDNTLHMNEIEFRRYAYISKKFTAFTRYNNKNPITHKFSYFLKMIEADA